MLTLKHSEVPAQLHQLHDVPSRLFVSGEGLDELMGRPRLGIIGSRKVSPYGRAVTSDLAGKLAQKGVVIVSGLALGVDSIAHESCLQVKGTTIAVLPAGLDRIYPSTHTQLAHRITSSGGLLVTEYPFNTEPLRPNFIARNRIIAGLAEGLLITEAAVNSGSLHTARFALELGIPVMAVPGQITSPTSEGTNNLIKAGAAMVVSINDIFHTMSWRETNYQPKDTVAYTEAERVIIELLQTGVSDGTALLEASKLEVNNFQQAMTMLELQGQIKPLGANNWVLG